MRFLPVAQRRIMSSSSARLERLSALPESIRRSSCSIATGVLESRMSRRSRRSASSRAMLRSTLIPVSRWRRSQASTAAGPPSVAISRSVARLLLRMSIASISAPALALPIMSSRRRRPASTSAR